MYKRVGFMLLTGLLILSGCMSSAYYMDDEDVAAIVRGEEITVGYLRFLYPEDAFVDMIDEVVKAKLAEQQVKKMKLDITEKKSEIERSFGEYPEEGVNDAQAQSIRAFADPMAKKLGMDPEEYYEKYTEVSAENAAYIDVYTSYLLGGLEDQELGIEEYISYANELLDDLVEMNSGAIEILIE